MEALGLLMTNWEVKYLYKINVQKKTVNECWCYFTKMFLL